MDSTIVVVLDRIDGRVRELFKTYLVIPRVKRSHKLIASDTRFYFPYPEETVPHARARTTIFRPRLYNGPLKKSANGVL